MVCGVTANRDLQEKSPTVLEEETVGQTFLFLGGFEEEVLRPASHSKPSMVVNISNPSTKIYVVFRKL